VATVRGLGYTATGLTNGTTYYFWVTAANGAEPVTQPADLSSGYGCPAAARRHTSGVIEAFRTGAGVGWHEHHEEVFSGCERFFRPGYAANLIASWISRRRRPSTAARMTW